MREQRTVRRGGAVTTFYLRDVNILLFIVQKKYAKRSKEREKNAPKGFFPHSAATLALAFNSTPLQRYQID